MSHATSRRRFLATSAAALGTPMILPSRVLGKDGAVAPGSKVRLACIGVGGMGTGNMQSFLNDERVQVVAVCDVDASHREAARNLAGLKEGDAYRDFRDVLARKDVDAVMNATPDHWHALIATAAAAAGKDLYTEKPLAGGIADGRAICKAVEAHQRVLQCGTWRRSVLKTRMACEWVRNGYIGDLQTIEIGVPGKFAISGGFSGLEPAQEVPPHLDYDLWLGPAPQAAYTAARCHFNFRWINDYAPGYITDWGAHFLDVAQWGAGRDDTAATEVSATMVTRRDKGIYDAPESFRIEYQYLKGPRMVMFSTTDETKWGVRFVGSAGSVFTENERLETDPPSLRTVKLKDGDTRLFESKATTGISSMPCSPAAAPRPRPRSPSGPPRCAISGRFRPRSAGRSNTTQPRKTSAPTKRPTPCWPSRCGGRGDSRPEARSPRGRRRVMNLANPATRQYAHWTCTTFIKTVPQIFRTSVFVYRSASRKSGWHRIAVIVLWVVALLPLIARAEPVMISEFMAANQTGIDDEDGDGSDWIELRNVSAAAVNLAGWTLTDNAALPAQWAFPAVSLPAGGYLVVFASGKDRAVAGSELHTNFELSSGGEYLGLFPPASTIPASQFAPAFPPQVTDISYGLGIDGQSVTLIAADAPCQVRVPVNGPLDTSWTSPDFVPAGWTTGQSGVGYELTSGGYAGMIRLQPPAMYGNTASCLLRFPFTLDNPASVSGMRLRLHYDDGFVMWLNGEQVASRNAPATLAWNSTATASNSNANAIAGELFNLSDFQDDLRPGTNVLAIQGMNQSSGNFDFLIVPVLEATSSTSATNRPAYFIEPTPGQANQVGAAELGPILREVGHSPTVPVAGGDLFVTARVSASFAPVASVNLTYHVMFGAEVIVPMRDDGASEDGEAGDGVYGATIPSSALEAGQMVRYFVSAEDTGARTFRWPMHLKPLESPKYLGSVVRNPALTNPLPVFHWFVQNTGAAETATGTRCSVFYLGEFYDNVFVRIRGASARSYAKKSFKFDFNPGHHFRFDPEERRVEEININTTYTDKSYIRTQLAYETIQESGSPGCRAFNLRMQRNNAFFSVAIFVEQVDEDFLIRQGLDPEGALYKPGPPYGVFRSAASTGAQASGWDKKTRHNESFADIQALEDGLRLTNINDRTRFLFDNVNLPAQVNYMAANIVIQGIDRIVSNFYAYRDTEGTGEWFMLTWDVDLTFGPVDLNTDTIRGNSDGAPHHLSHPLWGSKEFPYNNTVYNRFLDAIINTPATRAMFLRRLRSLSDQFLDPAQSCLEERMDQLLAPIGPDVILDHNKWRGNSHFAWSGATAYTPIQSVNRIKNEYLVQRRTHLFNTHVNNSTGIPSSQPPAAQIRFAALEVTPASGNQAEEFVQLQNDNAFAVDVSGWTLSGEVEYTFAPGTVIPSGTSLYLSPNVSAFRARATGPRGGQSLLVQGNYRGLLSARGGNLALHDTAGRPTGTHTYAGTPSLVQQFLRLTEIMYHPEGTGEAEYIELHNAGTSPLDLTGVRFIDGVDFSFTGGALTMLTPGARVLVVRNPAAMEARYGAIPNIAGTFTGRLDNAGERLRLVDASGEEVFDLRFDSSWHPVTDGLGFSLVAANESSLPAAQGDASQWRPSTGGHGSPGAGDPAPPVFPQVVINELLSRPISSPPLGLDSVELLNLSASPADISGWFLTDDLSTPAKFRIPDGTVIPAGGFVVFTEADFNPGGAGFAFDSSGDNASLVSADLAGALTGYLHGVRFGVAEAGVTFGRTVASDGREHFIPQSAATLGSANAVPRSGPIIISEIHFHPPPPAKPWVTAPVDGLEFIELLNISNQPVPLFDPAHPAHAWRLRGDADFDFPPGLTLPAGGIMLLVNFDPATNPSALAAFRAAWSPPPTVLIAGPYDEFLEDTSGWVELRRPDRPEGGTAGYIAVDSVTYGSAPPWRDAAGTGNSLHRIAPAAPASDPAHWTAFTPTAGHPLSPPPMDASLLEGEIRLSFPSLDGLRYQIQSSATLAHWEPTGPVLTGDGTIKSVSATITTNSRFYRLTLAP